MKNYAAVKINHWFVFQNEWIFSNVAPSLSNEAEKKRRRFHVCKVQKPDRQNLAGVRSQGGPLTAGQE